VFGRTIELCDKGDHSFGTVPEQELDTTRLCNLIQINAPSDRSLEIFQQLKLAFGIFARGRTDDSARR
jgi:hypothetical protein